MEYASIIPIVASSSFFISKCDEMNMEKVLKSMNLNFNMTSTESLNSKLTNIGSGSRGRLLGGEMSRIAGM